MKTVPAVFSALLAGQGLAQQASLFSDLSTIGWTELSPDGTKDETTGNVVAQNVVPESLFVEIQTQAEQDTEQAEIVEYRKKYDGIYDPNMYPYGPLHSDTRVPNADDAVSDPIDLPSPFPLFRNTFTNKFRASTNGLIALDDSSVVSDTPQSFYNNDINANFITGFWNDIWSKKHGRMYMRIEQTNTTLLDEIRDDIEAGLPQFGPNPDDGVIDGLLYAFIFSFWRVTHFGAIRNDDQKQNTFQIVLTTDGVHSFMMVNFQDVQWAQRSADFPFATLGYDVEGFNSGALPVGSGTAAMLDFNTLSTQSTMQGRHIFQLDDNAIGIREHPCDASNTETPDQCAAGSTCVENGVGYTCACPVGKMGEFCDEDDFCAVSNGGCLNGAACANGANGAECTCTGAFIGATCDEEDFCASGNGGCQNGATCTNGANGASCTCVGQFSGATCSDNIDPCTTSTPCQNGGTCSNDGSGGYTCACKTNFSGDDCETAPDMCTLEPCLNGSTCNDAGDGTRTCACVGDFEGADCECDGPCDFPDDTNIFENQWPSNDNCQEENPAGCLGGAIGAYRPSAAIENGTCTISFPEEPAYFHVFDAHIRADVASTPSTWNICAANSFFEPGEDGAFRYLVYFAPGSPFSQEDVVWNCDPADEYTYAIYSFPQNYLKKDGRSNIRRFGNQFDTTVSLSLGAQVVNFTVDDPRITVNSNDNQNYIFTEIPTSIEEVWFQFDYADTFFLSNTVGVAGST
jgi:hypothetical protein